MIRRLSIERFKSIRSLDLACRKVNVFIGAPDTGKTNVLEALYLVSRLGWGWPLDSSLRVRQELGFDALFYRQFFDKPFEITLDLDRPRPGLGDRVSLTAAIGGPDRRLRFTISPPGGGFEVTFGQPVKMEGLDWVRFYSYTSSAEWAYNNAFPHGEQSVATPHGYNLLYIARHNERVYDFLKETVSGLNWRLRFDQTLKAFRLSEVRQDEILDYNLDLLSDSLKRLFFYGAILLSSEDTTLVLDEPDVFAFPPYPKTLGEMIGGDATNQFFLTTHNPYFLAGILGKTRAEDLALFLCHRDSDGGTAVKLLESTDVETVIEQGASVFFNLGEFLPA